MFGWERAATAFASRSNRASASGSPASRSGRTFSGDVAVEAGVAGAVDLAHPARAEGREDLVRTQPPTRGQRHVDSAAMSHGDSSAEVNGPAGVSGSPQGGELHEHDAVAADGGGVAALEDAHVLLPPQVADDLLSGDVQVGPGRATSTVPSPRLKRPTAFEPSSRSRAQTSSGPCFQARRPGFPSGSWSTSITSSFVRSESVNGSRRVTSPLKMSGAATSDQSETWAYCSSA